MSPELSAALARIERRLAEVSARIEAIAQARAAQRAWIQSACGRELSCDDADWRRLWFAAIAADFRRHHPTQTQGNPR